MPVQDKPISITHDAIIDLVIAQPHLNYKEIGAIFNYTPVGIGIICRSDAFRARLAARKGELVDPLIKQGVEDRLMGLAHMSLDILEEKLKTSVDPKLALAALDATQKSAQYGARSGMVLNQQFVVHVPGPAASSQDWSQKFAPRAVGARQDAIEAAPAEAGGQAGVPVGAQDA